MANSEKDRKMPAEPISSLTELGSASCWCVLCTAVTTGIVWSPFVSTLLYKLKGHRAALVGCHAVEGTHELVTADCHCVLKLWDLRNFQCMQTFTSTHEPGDLDDLKGFQAFTHCQLPPKDPNQDMMDYRVVAGTKKLFFFDQHRVRKEPVTDDLPLRLVLLNEVSLTLLVVSDRSVKIWDAILGTLKRAYLDISPADITAVCHAQVD